MRQRWPRACVELAAQNLGDEVLRHGAQVVIGRVLFSCAARHGQRLARRTIGPASRKSVVTAGSGLARPGARARRWASCCAALRAELAAEHEVDGAQDAERGPQVVELQRL